MVKNFSYSDVLPAGKKRVSPLMLIKFMEKESKKYLFKEDLIFYLNLRDYRTMFTHGAENVITVREITDHYINGIIIKPELNSNCYLELRDKKENDE